MNILLCTCNLMKSKALLFGLNYAHLPSQYRLNGCINDVANMAAYLRTKLGVAEVECITDDTDLVNTSALGMVQKLYQAALQSYSEDLDFMWLHYSGHGTSVADRSGDERDRMDECLVPSDFTSVGVVSDDIIEQVLQHFNPKTRVVIIWDCCHSATMADLRYSWENPTRPVTENPRCFVRAKVLTLSGCLDNQTSADALINSRFAGAMTASLLGVMENDPACLQDVFQLLAALRRVLKDGGFEQVPKLCSSYMLSTDKAVVPM